MITRQVQIDTADLSSSQEINSTVRVMIQVNRIHGQAQAQLQCYCSVVQAVAKFQSFSLKAAPKQKKGERSDFFSRPVREKELQGCQDFIYSSLLSASWPALQRTEFLEGSTLDPGGLRPLKA